MAVGEAQGSPSARVADVGLALASEATESIDCTVAVDTCTRAPTDCPVFPFRTPDWRKHFSLGREIGRGSYGVVRECFDRKTGAAFACKVIQKKHLGTVQDRLVVAREVGLMRMVLGHPSVVSLEGAFESDDEVVIVMELCNGGELYHHILSHGRFPEPEAAAIFAQIVDAIAHCHRRGVMHRDLKPENILFHHRLMPPTEANPVESLMLEVKLADFGLGVWLGPGEFAKARIGSLMYEAPEVVCGMQYDLKADVWSLGVILHALLSGTLPFIDSDQQRLARKICAGTYELRLSPWPFVSDAAKTLIRRLIVVDPRRRPTALEILADPWLAQYLEPPSLPSPESPAPVTSPEAAPQKRKSSSASEQNHIIKSCDSPIERRRCVTRASDVSSPPSPRNQEHEEVQQEVSSACGRGSGATGSSGSGQGSCASVSDKGEVVSRCDSYVSAVSSVCSSSPLTPKQEPGIKAAKKKNSQKKYRHGCCVFVDFQQLPVFSWFYRSDGEAAEMGRGLKEGFTSHSDPAGQDKCCLLSPVKSHKCPPVDAPPPLGNVQGVESEEGELQYSKGQTKDGYYSMGQDADFGPQKRSNRMRRFLISGRATMRM